MSPVGREFLRTWQLFQRFIVMSSSTLMGCVAVAVSLMSAPAFRPGDEISIPTRRTTSIPPARRVRRRIPPLPIRGRYRGRPTVRRPPPLRRPPPRRTAVRRVAWLLCPATSMLGTRRLPITLPTSWMPCHEQHAMPGQAQTRLLEPRRKGAPVKLIFGRLRRGPSSDGAFSLVSPAACWAAAPPSPLCLTAGGFCAALTAA